MLYIHEKPAHALSSDEVIKHLETNKTAGLSAIQIPGFQQIFSTTSLQAYEWLIILAASAVIIAGIAGLNHPKKNCMRKNFRRLRIKLHLDDVLRASRFHNASLNDAPIMFSECRAIYFFSVSAVNKNCLYFCF